ncbi:family 10 glycosylhydrolase [Paenibacillus sp. MER TA 81-3]|uniref:family 10 glycosylhydrolase n=1 Tax=Paenibacillus sp. MER TA 81-3 TaxID=2939573 RepID=UPI00204149EE|nr:family 10 glycosylhydrolase [Paenibacillus sp. MER TA 81-3]MCM3340239.1 family 10 glycosylhydrolase [Paenibacillus sp. MER TA 81-3]
MNNVKRILMGACAAMMLSTSLPVLAAAAADDVSIFVNQRRLETDVAPYIVPGKNVTMLPFRAVGEAIGAGVDWDPTNRQVEFRKDGTVIKLTLGSSLADVNGENKELDVGATMNAGRTMVPLRFISENVGVPVNWDKNTRTVTLVTGSSSEDVGEEIHMDRLKGTWISTVYNIDWPQDPRKSGFNAEQQKQQYVDMLDKLKQMGMNSVFVQVRPTSDAFYPSKLLPWSEWLTGKQGQDPGYDPLAFMVEETHKRGMEFHAWFNPYRISVQGNLDKLVDDHPAKQHPEWVVKHSGKLLYNPGVPEARSFIADTIMEVVTQYDIDGVHLDDYFYPYGEDKEPFKDEDTYRKYNKVFNNKADWRRSNVNQFVQTVSEDIKASKPQVKFGISPFGVWRNSSADPTGSATKAGVSSYDNLYADTRTWIKNGWIDYIAPQVYWHIGHTAASYDTLVDWWVKETAGTGVDLYIGHAAYKLTDAKEKDWNSADVLVKQLDYNKQYNNIAGSIFFSATDLMKNTKQVSDRLQQYYKQ